MFRVRMHRRCVQRYQQFSVPLPLKFGDIIISLHFILLEHENLNNAERAFGAS